MTQKQKIAAVRTLMTACAGRACAECEEITTPDNVNLLAVVHAGRTVTSTVVCSTCCDTFAAGAEARLLKKIEERKAKVGDPGPLPWLSVIRCSEAAKPDGGTALLNMQREVDEMEKYRGDTLRGMAKALRAMLQLASGTSGDAAPETECNCPVCRARRGWQPPQRGGLTPPSDDNDNAEAN